MAGTPKPIKHGTKGGYMAHRRRVPKEAPCGRCTTAWRLYWQSRRGQLPRAVLLRNRAKKKKDLEQGRKDNRAWRQREQDKRLSREEQGDQAAVEDPTE